MTRNPYRTTPGSDAYPTAGPTAGPSAGPIAGPAGGRGPGDAGRRDDPTLDERIGRELEDGERLVWAGRPRAGLAALASLPIVLFAIPWTAFALFWTWGAGAGQWFRGGGNAGSVLTSVFPLFGVPFVLIGLAMLSSPIWAARSAGKTMYALTDRRCLVWNNRIVSEQFLTFGPEMLLAMRRETRKDGSGSLTFRVVPGERAGSSDTAPVSQGFMNIAEVAAVDRLVRETLGAAAAPGEQTDA